MALSTIHVRGFRSLRDVTLQPGPVTVLIGPNGSGKSNLLGFLRMVARARTGALRRFVGEAGGASALLHYGAKRTPEIAFELAFTNTTPEPYRYAALLGAAAGDTLTFLEESVKGVDGSRREERTRRLGAGHSESMLFEPNREPERETDVDRFVAAALLQVSDFHFHDTSTNSPLRSNAKREDAHYLRSDGSNLAAYLLALSESPISSHQKAWRRIHSLVRRIAPFIAELRPATAPFADPDRGPVRLDWLDDQGELFGPHHLSDGTLRSIALITALAQPAEKLPSFLAIDEPELGLHPAGISLLADLVRSVSGRCQVLLATQSPGLLDYFEPEEVVVAERADGATTLRRLDSADLEDWLTDYRLSDLFDKNVLGGRP